MSARILYIEDEPALAGIVVESLNSRGYEIDHFTDGTAARHVLAKADEYDLALLDVMLPWEDGLSLGRKLRNRYPSLPILFLTAKTQAADVVAGFEAGGNDYLRKPFSLEELIVRIENLVRVRSQQPIGSPLLDGAGCYTLGKLCFDPTRLTLRDAEAEQELVRLSHRESELLRYLADRAGEVVHRRDLLLALWQDDSLSQSRTLDVYVRKLRQVLTGEPAVELITLRGVGYRFVVGE
ncbi:MAG: response regulator transcription factor [Saprospiraceae bacterium]